MTLHRLRPLFLFITVVLCSGRFVSAQEPAPTTGATPSATLAEAPRPKARRADSDEHRFWDKTNDWLFAGVGASRTLDYFSTLNMRRRGRQEILLTDDVVDNHAAFAVIEAAGTGASIGAAYLFHRYGHHKLERWTSMVHIGLATSGSVRNYCLKTFHSTPPPSSP
jgi:hypothetical protein